jgi:hypothetical protein
MVMELQAESEITKKGSWKKRGALFGLVLSTIVLFFFHLGDPYYDNTTTAKQVFWYGIVPVVTIVSVLSFFIVGTIIDVIRSKKR